MSTKPGVVELLLLLPIVAKVVPGPLEVSGDDGDGVAGEPHATEVAEAAETEAVHRSLAQVATSPR